MNVLTIAIETVFSIGLFVNALLFLPQIIALLKSKDSKSVSLITFFGFCVTQLLTIFHSILFHDLILMLGYIASLALCGYLTFLIIYYRVSKKHGK